MATHSVSEAPGTGSAVTTLATLGARAVAATMASTTGTRMTTVRSRHGTLAIGVLLGRLVPQTRADHDDDEREHHGAGQDEHRPQQPGRPEPEVRRGQLVGRAMEGPRGDLPPPAGEQARVPTREERSGEEQEDRAGQGQADQPEEHLEGPGRGGSGVRADEPEEPPRHEVPVADRHHDGGRQARRAADRAEQDRGADVETRRATAEATDQGPRDGDQETARHPPPAHPGDGGAVEVGVLARSHGARDERALHRLADPLWPPSWPGGSSPGRSPTRRRARSPAGSGR